MPTLKSLMISESIGHNAFAKYGHMCFLVNTDPLEAAFPKKNFKSIFLYKLYKLIMVANDNPMSKKFLKSQAAINSEKIKHLKLKHWMVHPFSKFRMFWETWMSLMFIISFIFIPFDIFIPSDDVYEFEMILALALINISFVFDICAKFYTGYHTINAEIEMDFRTVRRNYFYGRFIFDVIAALPYAPILYSLRSNIQKNETLRYFSCLRLTVYLHAKLLFVYIRRLGDVFEVNDVVMNGLVTIVFYTLFLHFMSCVQILPWYSRIDDNNWVSAAELWEKNAFLKYVVCAYRAVSITSNVSHGPLLPRTLVDVFMIGLCAMAGCLVSYYLLSEMSRFITARESTKIRYEVLFQQLRQYSLYKGFTERTRERVIGYHNFRYKGSYYREDEILGCISIQLRQEVIMHKCRRLVENVIFFNKLPLSLLGNIVSCLKMEIFLANDVIIRYGDIGDCMYFIASGTVAIYTKTGKEVCHLEDGGHFGEVALVVQKGTRVASVISIEICELYRLDRKEFLQAIVPYPDLYREIEHIALEREESILFLDELHVLRTQKIESATE